MQDRNAEMVVNLVQDFTTRDEHAQSGARLSDVMMWLNRDGGGSLMWAFDGQSQACYGGGSASQWGYNGGITLGNYAATTRGGPYVTLDGIGEYLDIADATWQESLTYNFLVWAWCYIDATGTTHAIAGKWTAAGNLRSWYLLITGAGVVRLATSANGIASVTLDSSVTLTTAQWYFTAGYFVPSTLMRVFTGSASDGALTIDSLATGVPASLFDGVGPPLTIGATSGGSFLSGRRGVGLARANVPAANINSYVTRLFQATRWFYGG